MSDLEECVLCKKVISRVKDKYIAEGRTKESLIFELKSLPFVVNLNCKYINLVPRLFTYARRFEKDPGWSWSRDSLKNPLLYRVEEVSNYMLPHTSDTFQMQGVRFHCYERQYKLFDLKLSIFVYFVCFISFIIVSV